ncbi:MAG: outer membrane beta-barrel protein [Acidobacteria bacterium]|nr:outer membrane beta-barrel protein [Acidobacteriota bacterium]
MMRRLWVLVCVLMGTAAAYGQAAEASVSLGVGMFSDKNLGDLGVVNAVQQTLRLDNGFRISARLDINSWRFFSHEIGYGYNRTHLVAGQDKVGMGIHQGFYDFLVHATPEGSGVRPFVCGGGGFASYYPPGASAFAGNGITKFGYNYGGGVKVKLSPIYGVRFDIRDYVTAKPFDLPNVKGRLHNIEVSAGVSILF